MVVLIFGLMCILTYITFRLSNMIEKKIGENVISVIGKIMGLIIAIIIMNMVIEGIKLSFDLVK